ncbi:MAG: glycerophosphodiester phosphodiesterase family protein [Alphaproteobacteria bacterium]|nr:glycerophosphodiester phosphodiesterase family protein [Alphaproteobacteria bacterium]
MSGKAIHIFAHRGCGVTDNGPQGALDAKGTALCSLPPENSEEAIETAFRKGYPVEIDVTMTLDGHVIVTHTNDLSFHNVEARRAREEREKGKGAKENDWYVSRKTFEEMRQLRTGLGGRTAPFLTYDRFIGLMRKYPSAVVNVEIKGTIQGELMAEPKEPSLVEMLAKRTPNNMLDRIIWSSFAVSNLHRLRLEFKKKSGKPRKNMPHVHVAQLFAEPDRLKAHGGEEDRVYPDTDDSYMQFTEENVARVNRKDVKAVHPSIDSLMTEEGAAAVRYCAKNGITIRTWALNEKNPGKETEASALAQRRIERILEYRETFPELQIDIITDYPEEVEKVVASWTMPTADADVKRLPYVKNGLQSGPS